MDARAAIPVTLPRANPTISYWQDPPDPEVADYLSGNVESRSRILPETADILIIGSGITGSCIAYNLLQDQQNHGKNIVMLEARQACSGATGRNGIIPSSPSQCVELTRDIQADTQKQPLTDLSTTIPVAMAPKPQSKLPVSNTSISKPCIPSLANTIFRATCIVEIQWI
jgi:FAD dependent oxidoreductase